MGEITGGDVLVIEKRINETGRCKCNRLLDKGKCNGCYRYSNECICSILKLGNCCSG